MRNATACPRLDPISCGAVFCINQIFYFLFYKKEVKLLIEMQIYMQLAKDLKKLYSVSNLQLQGILKLRIFVAVLNGH